jgi:hypothetical protein
MIPLKSTPHHGSVNNLESDLLSQLAYVFNATGKAIQDFVLSQRLAKWRLISTAPSNQELELRIVEDGKSSVLEFPCLRTNADAWINVDLGSEIKFQAVEWRLWRRPKAPQPHHARIKFGGRQAILRHVRSTRVRALSPVWSDAIQ